MRKIVAKVIATVRSAYPELVPLFRQRMEEEGYDSLSSYFFWTAFYDLILRKPHKVTARTAHMLASEQENAVRTVIENFEAGPKPGGFFEAEVQRAANEEHWRLHAQVRELKARVTELERALLRHGIDPDDGSSRLLL